jgi:soluble lytic murein transglycosylase
MLEDITRRRFLKGLLAATAAVVVVPLPAMAMPSGLAVQSIQTALRGDFMTAGDMAQRSGDQAAVKLVELLFLRDHGAQAGHERISAFLEAAPEWPLTDTLKKRAEQALYENNQDANVTLRQFSAKAPVTPYGMLALARAHYAVGNSSKGKYWLSEAWQSAVVGTELEPRILAEFGNQLNKTDHQRRFYRMICAQQGSDAMRNAKRLGGDYVRVAGVAQQLLRGSNGADGAYNALPASFKNELAMKLILARFYRRQENYEKARSILLNANGNEAVKRDAAAWWSERRIIIRRSVGPNHSNDWNAAYQLSANHGLSEGEDAIEAEFLAGWTALRYLRKPDVALKHFAKLNNLAATRSEKARAAYWIGRSYLVLGNKSAARSSFSVAANFSTVYYGQLAREMIGLGNEPERINGGQASAAATNRVQRDEVVRAMRLMAQAGAKNQTNIFLWSLANRFDSVDELNAVASEVQNIAGTSWSLRLAKAVSQRGLDIDAWSYPVRGLPNWSQVGKPIEKSLVFALSRQESEFDPNAGSTVGAQGLMQLMPATARLVAKQYRLPFVVSKLKGDPSYNVKLGAAHLADLVDSFNGSYVLTLVGYNAGPRRSREWVDEFGDPRAGQVDAVDWVECIPFEETRWYVQKVMQNLHVYRSRLAPNTVRPMTVDLNRGTPNELTVASTSEVNEPIKCKKSALTTFLGGTCN